MKRRNFLSLATLPAAASLASALTYHILTYIPITLLGAWSLTRTGLKLGDLRQSSTTSVEA